jgi:HrpA-like RNA helicase
MDADKLPEIKKTNVETILLQVIGMGIKINDF